MAKSKIVNDEERIMFSLRELYEAYGYSRYKMLKFEEYDFYSKNKDFLVSDSIITFNDTNGKLMAMKPDVTLSIIKNTEDIPGERRKVYYNENVYRVSKNSRTFREIMQTGVECIGDIDAYCVSEILSLAASSLKLISENSILSISNLDIISYAVDLYTGKPEIKKQLISLTGEKNVNAITALCRKENISAEGCEALCGLAKLHGKAGDVFPELRKLLPGCKLIDAFEKTVEAMHSSLKNMTEIDFSYSGDIKYYNGIVFKGYVQGIPESVLSGGQYDGLMKRMGRSDGAVGFAVYLGTVERLVKTDSDYDVDTVILYGPDTDIAAVSEEVKKAADSGVTVTALKSKPGKLKYRRIINLCEGGGE
ncbi:MAG: ATP phosphoribosyltransferase regulatory subunit [Clostridia bacterium]|nr:ATP phosphoribosyltransferase regulatory subunit [Clostridia bacterium]